MKRILLFLTIVMIVSLAHSQFTNIYAGLTAAYTGSSAWGDIDNDGDMDLAYTGYSTVSNFISKIYRNDSGVFSDINAGLVGVEYSSLDWGDYDRDGYLDLLLTGYNGSTYLTKIYHNNGNSTFTDIAANVIGVDSGQAKWGDMNNDGLLDILITGYSTSSYISRVYYNQGGGNFADLSAGLEGLWYSSCDWADLDGDGDLDIIIMGYNQSNTLTKVYRNDNSGTFVNVAVSLPALQNGSIDCADYDNDGDLDILMTGKDYYSSFYTRVYRNNGGFNFTALSASFANVVYGDAEWGDYDNDGDADILLVGNGVSSTEVLKVYRNNGSDSFTEMNYGLTGLEYSSCSWADYDNDGDPDFFASGYNGISLSTGIYRNDYNVADSAPTAPVNLSYTNDGTFVTFNWTAGTDAQTPAAGLNYALRMGTTPGGMQLSAPSAFTNGVRKTSDRGSINSLSWKIRTSALLNSNEFYWSVQSVDPSFKGSAFTTEQMFKNIRITSPLGGETWKTGSTKTVTWYAQPNINFVNILLSVNNGSSWISLNASPIAASQGYYTFTVPYTTSTTCLIKINNNANTAVYDICPANFSISGSTSYSLNLTAPTAAALQAGKTYNISWNSTGISQVNLEYSNNSGQSWNLIQSGVSATASPYAWTVPNTPGAICYLRVSDTANPQNYDVNDSPFKISYLQLLTPNGGELYQTGSTKTVSWIASQISQLNLDYSIDNGVTWFTSISGLSSTGGSYSWPLPGTASNQFLIRLSDTYNPDISDYADAVLTVASLAVTYPSVTGLKLQAGRTYNITWNQQFLPGNVNIELSTNNGSTWSTLVSDLPATLGTYAWTVPFTTSINCRIRIKSAIDNTIMDSGDNNFTITKLQLTAPNGGEVWGGGTSHQITWSAANTSTLKIEYSNNNGSTWNQLVASTSASTGYYNWSTPAVNSSLCRVRITDNGYNQTYDISDTTFTIRPQVMVSSPNGGEILTVGTIYSILWTNTAEISNVALDYSIDGGTSWLPIQTSSYPAASGLYEWIVPNTPSANCKIRVKNYSNASVNDVSDAVFTITPQIYPPTADFSAALTSGLEPLAVQFTDLSQANSGSLTSWLWNFGDGNTSAEQHPFHIYQNDGTYTVTLTVTNTFDSTATLTRFNYIDVLPRFPVAELITESPLAFGMVYLGSQSTQHEVWLRNTGTASLSVSGLAFGNSQSAFVNDGTAFPMSIAAGDSAAVLIRFIPQTAGGHTDSLFITSDASNAPVLSIELTGTCEYVPPKPPQDVSVVMNGTNAAISWSAVTETIFDTPIAPDYYLVFYNGSADPEGEYYYLGYAEGLAFTHPRVGQHASHMYYRIVAYKDFTSARALTMLRRINPGVPQTEVLSLLKSQR